MNSASTYLRGHKQRVRRLVFSHDGKALASFAGRAHTIWVWDVESRQPREYLSGHRRRLMALAVSPSQRMLASLDFGGTVKLWTFPEGAPRKELQANGTGAHDLVYSPDGSLLAVPHSYTVTVFDTKSGKTRATIKDIPYEIAAMAFAPDGETLAILHDRYVWLWNAESKRLRAPLKLDTIGYDIAFAPDSRQIVVGGGWSNYVWDVEHRKETHVLRGHQGIIWSVEFSPDGALLASASNDGTVRFWTTSTWEEYAVESLGSGKIAAMLFTPDGDHFAAGGQWGDIILSPVPQSQ